MLFRPHGPKGLAGSSEAGADGAAGTGTCGGTATDTHAANGHLLFCHDLTAARAIGGGFGFAHGTQFFEAGFAGFAAVLVDGHLNSILAG